MGWESEVCWPVHTPEVLASPPLPTPCAPAHALCTCPRLVHLPTPCISAHALQPPAHALHNLLPTPSNLLPTPSNLLPTPSTSAHALQPPAHALHNLLPTPSTTSCPRPPQPRYPSAPTVN
nr:extensin-like [Procambarus clarkii]